MAMKMINPLPPSPRANFLVPTLMDKVYLEGERQANLEVVLSCFGNNMATTFTG